MVQTYISLKKNYKERVYCQALSLNLYSKKGGKKENRWEGQDLESAWLAYAPQPHQEIIKQRLICVCGSAFPYLNPLWLERYLDMNWFSLPKLWARWCGSPLTSGFGSQEVHTLNPLQNQATKSKGMIKNKRTQWNCTLCVEEKTEQKLKEQYRIYSDIVDYASKRHNEDESQKCWAVLPCRKNSIDV